MMDALWHHRRLRKMDRYTIMQLIGRGNFGTVHLARSTEDGRLYVMKRININELSPTEREGALYEVYA